VWAEWFDFFLFPETGFFYRRAGKRAELLIVPEREKNQTIPPCVCSVQIGWVGGGKCVRGWDDPIFIFPGTGFF
jgi:hypothetical protein